MPADALWTFAMGCNVWLSFFRSYDAAALRRLEYKYLLACYGLPFIPALVYLFVSTIGRGKIYGSAVVSQTHPWLGPVTEHVTALVLDFAGMGLSTSCHILWTCLVYHPLDDRHLYPSRLGHFQMAQAASVYGENRRNQRVSSHWYHQDIGSHHHNQ